MVVVVDAKRHVPTTIGAACDVAVLLTVCVYVYITVSVCVYVGGAAGSNGRVFEHIVTHQLVMVSVFFSSSVGLDFNLCVH